VIDTQPVPTARALLELDASELALLGALEHLLAAACAAVEAANPELLAHDPDNYLERPRLPRIWSARDIRERAHVLAESISRYRHALHLADDVPPATDWPF